MNEAVTKRFLLYFRLTGEGIDELRAFLNEDVPKLSLEEAKFRQSLGLNEWDPLPEGVEY